MLPHLLHPLQKAILASIQYNKSTHKIVYISITTMVLPDIIVQEVRNVLALHCREIVMVNRADGEKSDKQMELYSKCFHGTESHASVLGLLLGGRGLYANAFDKAEIELNRAGNEDRAKDGCMLVLKEILHCDPGNYIFIRFNTNDVLRIPLTLTASRSHGTQVPSMPCTTTASTETLLLLPRENSLPAGICRIALSLSCITTNSH